MTSRNEITIIVSLKWYSCARRTFSVGAKERNDLNMKKEYKMSAERKEELQNELTYLKTVREQEVADLIKEARGFGDLSENFEYKAAKREKNRNDSRIRYLQRMVDTAKVISDHSSGDVVGLFDKVVIYIPDDDEEQTIRLVTTLRQNALEGLISKESPVGKAVMGHRAGETVHVQVNETVGYDIVIRSVEKGQDDDSLPISAY